MPYKWLLFDADGTLFDYERAEASALEKTFRQAGVPFQPGYLAAYQRINQQVWRALENGQMSLDELRRRRFEMLLDAIDVSHPPHSFSAVYLEHLATSAELVDGAREVLQQLHQRYRCVILTNGLTAVQRGRLARSAIRDYIGDLIISEEVGAAKPDRAIFDVAFARMGHPSKSEVLMIGDSLTSDIQGGCNYGVDTCWYNPTHQPRPQGIEITYEIAHLTELLSVLD
jgi:YjjG family noncanonical pyrimidine nucleotidase